MWVEIMCGLVICSLFVYKFFRRFLYDADTSNSKAETSESKAETSESNVKTSDSNVETSDTSNSKVETSESKAETSDSNVETSVAAGFFGVGFFVVLFLIVFFVYTLFRRRRDDTSNSKVETSNSNVETSDSNVETSDSNVLFSVAARLEKLCGGKVYTGLRIPDADTKRLQSIDMVLVTKGGEAVVISVQNLSGFVSINADGSWVPTGRKSHETEYHQDPVAEVKREVAILESYLERRGATLPEGYLSCKVICAIPSFRTIHSDHFPSEVKTHEGWIQLKPELNSIFSGSIKGAFSGGKKEMQEAVQKLNFILSTAPTWDRLELEGNEYVLGEFLEFQGTPDDVQSLKTIKRSKVSRLIIQKTSIFGIVCALQVLYFSRDYRNKGASASERREMTVGSRTEVLFKPQNLAESCKFKLSSIVSMSLSA